MTPYTTINYNCASGDKIIIEQRDTKELRGVKGHFGDGCWAPTNANVYNPAFDVTPAKFVTRYVLDSGILEKISCKNTLKSIRVELTSFLPTPYVFFPFHQQQQFLL